MNKTIKVLKWILFPLAGIIIFVVVISVVSDSSKKLASNSPTPNGFKLLCSKKESDGHGTDYFEVLGAKPGDHLVLNKKITDVTVSISKITSSGGWDTNSLCGSDSLVDLAQSDWQILTIGEDCGYGATVEACDFTAVEDPKGINELVLNSKEALIYFARGHLVRITSILVK
jgi:hypothetical protein